MMKTLSRILAVLFFLPLTIGEGWGGLPSQKMDYRDYDEMYSALDQLSRDYADSVTLKSIGTSRDLYSDPNNPRDYEIYAIRIGPIGIRDSFALSDTTPTILFEAGIHGREWLATESLIELARYLAEKSTDRGSPVYALLQDMAVWIIPMSNPAGRMIDDAHHGDPERFFPGTGNARYGWRHSGDTRGCASAVDINRNFSTDWGNAGDAGCGWSDHYEGLAPFSTPEAAALRQFVQNHWVSMAVDVHTTSQRLWNRWGNSDPAGAIMRHKAVAQWRRGLSNLAGRIYDPPHAGAPVAQWMLWYMNTWGFVDRFNLDQIQTGTGGGQFTAWLGEPQQLQSFVIELPPNNADYANYYGFEFQHDPSDRSNSFHPSSSRVGSLVHSAFIPMAMRLIEQAHAPFCSTSVGYVYDGGRSHAHYRPERDGCMRRNYGILAAKIGRDPRTPGLLDSVPAVQTESAAGVWQIDSPANDYLYLNDGPDWTYKLHYWVQNYSESFLWDRPAVLIKLRSRDHDLSRSDYPTLELSERRYYALELLEKAYDVFTFDVVPDKDYELEIYVYNSGFSRRMDQFLSNNTKVFRFSTVRSGERPDTDG